MMLAIFLAAFTAQLVEPAQPVTKSSFDLPPSIEHDHERTQVLAPEQPPNFDLRDFAVDAPEAELRLAADGPVIAIGAMGGKRSGRPKLAHVALDWTF